MAPRFEAVRKFGSFEPDEHERKQVHPGLSIPGQVAVVGGKNEKIIVVDEAMVSTVTEYLPVVIKKAKTFDSDEVVILVKPDEQGLVWKIDNEGIKPVTDYASITVDKAPKVEGFNKFIR
ncbi:hypothetical protein KKB64_04115 [Patescibacteria group bacterium]|nr:hypothetical protein [Patescibacteria group bacterium]MBU1472943.1 hypothetical protein [Patescibacteria group bacterium]MBU2459709.1 hypothetical protein [Patescibacteria group bacterium]